jgi:DNA-binding transcriptional ArsR family regulator
MRNLERTLKALANRRRLAIVAYLKKEREAPVGEIAGEIELSFKATSKHLRVLAAADIVEHDQRSLQMYYRLTPTNAQTPAARAIISFL